MASKQTTTDFTLSAEDNKKVKDWFESIKPEILKKSPPNPVFGNVPYYGAVGGGLEYIFTPTSIGVIVKVKEAYTGLELDLTDWDLF